MLPAGDCSNYTSHVLNLVDWLSASSRRSVQLAQSVVSREGLHYMRQPLVNTGFMLNAQSAQVSE